MSMYCTIRVKSETYIKWSQRSQQGDVGRAAEAPKHASLLSIFFDSDKAEAFLASAASVGPAERFILPNQRRTNPDF